MTKTNVNRAVHSVLELDGQLAGMLLAAPGQGNLISLKVGAGMSSAFYRWIGAFLQRRPSPKNIVIYSTDSRHEVQSAKEYVNCRISKVSLPKLSAVSKERVWMELTLRGKKLRDSSPSGKLKLPAASKQFLQSNFRVSIGSMPTERVVSVNQFTASAGDYSNLVISVHMEDFSSFEKWHSSRTRGSGEYKSGTVEYLTPSLKDVGFTLSLGGLRIVRLSPNAAASHTFEVEMAVSSASFEDSRALLSHFPRLRRRSRFA